MWDKEKNLLSQLEETKFEWDLKSQNTFYEVSEQNVADVVAMMTGIPVNKVAESETQRLVHMEDYLKKVIIGQDESIEKISKSIKRLWETGLYENINISITKISGNVVFLDIFLVERARLVSFGFKGTSKNEETELREKIKISQGNIVNDNMKQTSINLIEDYYVEKGYYNCKVSVSEEKDAKISNAVNLVFNVAKNKKVKIENIKLIGNNAVTKAHLVRAFKETKENK